MSSEENEHGWLDEDAWLFDDDDECDREMAAFEQAVQDCGQNEDATWCDLAGTEHCDFRCRFRRSLKL